MTKKDLLDYLKDVPDEAVVYTYADHGQTGERAHWVDYSDFSGELPYYDDDGLGSKVFLHEEDRGYAVEPKNATAVCIGA